MAILKGVFYERFTGLKGASASMRPIAFVPTTEMELTIETNHGGEDCKYVSARLSLLITIQGIDLGKKVRAEPGREWRNRLKGS